MKFATVFALLAFSQLSLAALSENDNVVRASLKEELATRNVTCESVRNTAGYSVDGKLNFNSFLENVSTQIVINEQSGQVIVQFPENETSDLKLKIQLSSDLMLIESFDVTVDAKTTVRKRFGNLLNPQYENVTEKVNTFDLRCKVQQ